MQCAAPRPAVASQMLARLPFALRKPHAVAASASASTHVRNFSCSPVIRPLQHGVRRGRCSGIAQAAPQKVTEAELHVALESRDVPIIIDFYATWCGPCLLLAKELDRVAADLGEGVKILKVDTDENPELSSQLQIQGLPTMVFVGTDTTKPALRTEGLLPAETIKQIVADEIGG